MTENEKQDVKEVKIEKVGDDLKLIISAEFKTISVKFEKKDGESTEYLLRRTSKDKLILV